MSSPKYRISSSAEGFGCYFVEELKPKAGHEAYDEIHPLEKEEEIRKCLQEALNNFDSWRLRQ